MLRKRLPELCGAEASNLAERVWEFSRFLVEIARVEDVGARFGVVVVVGAEELDVRKILGRLEDTGDLETRLGGVVDRGGGSASRESLQLDGPAGIEHVERFGGH